MGELINLNKARKTRYRAQAKADAAANRVRFGRTGGQKAADRMELKSQSRSLDEKQLDRSQDD